MAVLCRIYIGTCKRKFGVDAVSGAHLLVCDGVLLREELGSRPAEGRVHLCVHGSGSLRLLQRSHSSLEALSLLCCAWEDSSGEAKSAFHFHKVRRAVKGDIALTNSHGIDHSNRLKDAMPHPKDGTPHALDSSEKRCVRRVLVPLPDAAWRKVILHARYTCDGGDNTRSSSYGRHHIETDK